MHRFAGGLIAKRIRGAVAPRAALGAAGLLAVAAAPAGATITPTARRRRRRERALVRLRASPSSVQSSRSSRRAAQGNPVGTGDAMSGLDRRSRVTAPSYLVLSTGDATQADQPDQPGAFPSVDDGGATPRSRGDSAFDVSSPAISVQPAPPAARRHGLLRFDFRFLSEEYPARLGSPFNDALRRRGRQRDARGRAGRRPRSRRPTTSPRSPAASR